MGFLKGLKGFSAAFLVVFCTSCATVCPTTGSNSMTDDDITTTVQVRFASDTGLAQQPLYVSTYERVVTLCGYVENPTQKCIAEKLARTVPGVCRVISKIKIKHGECY